VHRTKLQISEILSSSKLNVNEEFKGLFNETAGAVERGSGTVAILFDLVRHYFYLFIRTYSVVLAPLFTDA